MTKLDGPTSWYRFEGPCHDYNGTGFRSIKQEKEERISKYFFVCFIGVIMSLVLMFFGL